MILSISITIISVIRSVWPNKNEKKEKKSRELHSNVLIVVFVRSTPREWGHFPPRVDLHLGDKHIKYIAFVLFSKSNNSSTCCLFCFIYRHVGPSLSFYLSPACSIGLFCKYLFVFRLKECLWIFVWCRFFSGCHPISKRGGFSFVFCANHRFLFSIVHIIPICLH